MQARPRGEASAIGELYGLPRTLHRRSVAREAVLGLDRFKTRFRYVGRTTIVFKSVVSHVGLMVLSADHSSCRSPQSARLLSWFRGRPSRRHVTRFTRVR